MDLESRRWEQLVGTYESYPIIFYIHLDGFVLVYTRIWWASNLHENYPKVYTNDTLAISMIKNILRLKCKHMTLAISMLKNQVSLAYVNTRLSSNGSQRATLNVIM